jgi:hypothetical protein
MGGILDAHAIRRQVLRLLRLSRRPETKGPKKARLFAAFCIVVSGFPQKAIQPQGEEVLGGYAHVHINKRRRRCWWPHDTLRVRLWRVPVVGTLPYRATRRKLGDTPRKNSGGCEGCEIVLL